MRTKENDENRGQFLSANDAICTFYKIIFFLLYLSILFKLIQDFLNTLNEIPFNDCGKWEI